MSDFPKELCFTLKEPINDGDTDTTTNGCRHSNPDICGSCCIDGVCAFTSKDHICKKPSMKWKKFYKKIKETQ